jgi:hypothetical protein
MKATRATVACACLGVIACAGQRSSVAPNEPIQVAGGQFIAGPLPGTPPQTLDAGPVDPAALTHLAIDDAVSRPFGPLIPGAAHQQFKGLATQDTVAIGVALAGAGTGYWVVPALGLDSQMLGEVDWELFVDFNLEDPPGRHKLRLVALDATGAAGRQVDVPVCIDSAVPDNGHACIPDQAPPTALISLLWDDNFDLDLHVVGPDGVDVSAKPPTAGASDGGAADGGPAIDRDSLRSCVSDGLRREDVVFQNPPGPGVYGLYVKPFAACGQTAVRFTVTVYARAGTCPDCTLQSTFVQSGELLASQVTGDTGPGLFIQQIELPKSP